MIVHGSMYAGPVQFRPDYRPPEDLTPKPAPILSPAEAFASNAKLGPPNGNNPQCDNHISKVHTEIKVGGKVIARVYNGGAAEIAGGYEFLNEQSAFNGESERDLRGPALAEHRVAKIKAVLERNGASLDGKQAPGGPLVSLAASPVLEVVRAATAETMDEWLETMAKNGGSQPGRLLSKTA